MKISPKLNYDKSVYSQNSWYYYYAGYADEFIKNAIEKYGKFYHEPIIVDPWNGSGTTSLVASMMGLTCYGFDINPVMIVIAKAKLFDTRKLEVKEIEKYLLSIQISLLTEDQYSEDPLNSWFTIESLSAIRLIEDRIQIITGIKQKDDQIRRIKEICNVETLDNEVCFYYLIFFTTLKQFTKVFVGSNPTWIKTKNLKKLNPKLLDIISNYLNILENMKRGYSEGGDSENIFLETGNSKNIPLGNETANMVITSPPYCTRIDYAVYTKIELSLLGYNSIDIKGLRREMIGTPTVQKGVDCVKYLSHNQMVSFSETCFKILESIYTHESKAAKGYYFKTYVQYFSGMYQSLNEIYRILKNNGVAIIVVQDSWFKEINVDVSKVISEFGKSCGFTIIEKIEHEVRSNLNYINSKSRKYKNKKTTVESVIVFMKG